MNNNKNSKLKNLLLGTTVLTAALGFVGQAWGANNVTPLIGNVADIEAAAVDGTAVGGPQYYRLKGATDKLSAVTGVECAAWAESDASTPSVQLKNAAGVVTFDWVMSGKTKVAVVAADPTHANLVTIKWVAVAPNTSDWTYIALLDRSLADTVDGGGLEIKTGGNFAFVMLDNGATAFAQKKTLWVSNDDPLAPAKINGIFNATNFFTEQHDLSFSGKGAKEITFDGANDATIAGISAAKDTGAIVLAANAGGARTLTMSSFNVDSASGVMVHNTNAGNTNSLVVKTTPDAAKATAFYNLTMSAGASAAATNYTNSAGVLSGNNTDVSNVSFNVEGTGTLVENAAANAGDWTFGGEGKATINVQAQSFNDIGAVGARTAGKYEVWTDSNGVRFFKGKDHNAGDIRKLLSNPANDAAVANAADTRVAGQLTLTSKMFTGVIGGTATLAIDSRNITLTAKGAGVTYAASAADDTFDKLDGDLDNGKTFTIAAGYSATVTAATANDVIVSRKLIVNAPIVMAANKSLKPLAGADINSNVVLHTNAQSLKFDGGAGDAKLAYNVSARAYVGNAGAAGKLQDVIDAYNAVCDSASDLNVSTLATARLALDNEVAASILANLDSVPLYTIANGAVVNFSKEKDGSYYVGQTNAANGVMNLGQDAQFHGALVASTDLELTMAQGSALAVYADSEVKNLTLGPVLTTGSGDSVKNVTSSQTIKFAKVASANAADVNAKFDVVADAKITFTGDTKLVLDVSDNAVGSVAGVAGTADGKFTLSTRKLVVTSNVLDKDGKAVVGSAGSVAIQSARIVPTTGTLAAATAADDRNVTFITESSFGEKDHVLKNFSASGEHAFTMTLGNAARKLHVYADEVSLAAAADQTFTLDTGVYNFNTSKMSVTSKDSLLTLANTATLNVNALAGTKELAVDFSVAGGKITFNKDAVVALGKNATKFDDVDFTGGLKFDGAATFDAQDAATPPVTKTVNVTGSFAVNQDVVIGLANFTGSDITSVSVLASVTLTDAQAKQVIFVDAMKKAGSAIEIGTKSRFVVNGLVNAGMLNGTNFKVAAAGMVKGETFDLITSDQNIDSTVDTSTLGQVATVGNERLTFTFVNGGKKAISVCADVIAPTADDLKKAGVELSDSEKVAQDLIIAAWNKNIIKTDSPLGKALSSDDKVVGLATKAIAPHTEDIVMNVTADAGAVSSVVGERVAELRVGAASGDAEQPKLGAWAQVNYGSAEQKAFDSVAGYKRSTVSGVVGFDFAMNESHLMGLAGGYVSSSSDFTTGLARKDEYTTLAFNQYSSHDLTESVFLNQNLTFAKATPKRTIKITEGGADVTSSDYEVVYAAFGASLGWSVNMGNAVIFTPTLGGRYQMLSDYDFDYKNVGGDKVDTKTKSVKHSSFVVTGGMSFAYPVQNEDYTFSPELSGGFEYDTNPHKGESSMSLTGLPQAFDANVASVKPTNLSFNAGVALNAKYGMYELSPKANFSFGKEYFGWTGALKVRVNF